jgi:hypothetical protein
MGLWDAVKRFFTGDEPSKQTEPSAGDVLKEMRRDKKRTDPEWDQLRNRLATLVLSEADQQRLWRRAHRGAPDSARLLSGIVAPTADEKRILADLVKELEAGR